MGQPEQKFYKNNDDTFSSRYWRGDKPALAFTPLLSHDFSDGVVGEDYPNFYHSGVYTDSHPGGEGKAVRIDLNVHNPVDGCGGGHYYGGRSDLPIDIPEGKTIWFMFKRYHPSTQTWGYCYSGGGDYPEASGCGKESDGNDWLKDMVLAPVVETSRIYFSPGVHRRDVSQRTNMLRIISEHGPTYDDSSSADATFPLDRWFTSQIMVKVASDGTGIMRGWIDGKLVVEAIGPNTSVGNALRQWGLGDYWNGVPYTNGGLNQDHFWIKNVVIATDVDGYGAPSGLDENGNAYIDPAPFLADTPASGEYSVSGLTGLGAKPGTPYYENFESRSVGALSGPVGELQISNSNGGSITASRSHSGTKCIAHDYAIEDFPKHFLALSGTQRKVSLSCYLYMEGSSGTSPNNCVRKFTRAGYGEPYVGVPVIRGTYVSGSNSTAPETLSCEMLDDTADFVGYAEHNTSVADPATAFTSGTWHYCKWLFDFGTLGGANASFIERVGNKETVNIANKNMITIAPARYPQWVITPMCGFDDEVPNTSKFYVDELLIDESWCAWVVTDNADYSLSTKYADQVITGWSDTGVTASKKRGAFSVGETAYHHIFNNNGTEVYTSPAFTITEDNV